MPPDRLKMYVPVVRKFVSRLLLFHSAVAMRIGLNASDLTSLRLLSEGSLPAGSLAEQIGLTPAATTALIDRLEKAGFLKRKRSTEDRRLVTVHVNHAKLTRINALYSDQGARMEKLLNSYNDEQFQAVMDFLEKTTSILAEQAEAVRSPSPGKD